MMFGSEISGSKNFDEQKPTCKRQPERVAFLLAEYTAKNLFGFC